MKWWCICLYPGDIYHHIAFRVITHFLHIIRCFVNAQRASMNAKNVNSRDDASKKNDDQQSQMVNNIVSCFTLEKKLLNDPEAHREKQGKEPRRVQDQSSHLSHPSLMSGSSRHQMPSSKTHLRLAACSPAAPWPSALLGTWLLLFCLEYLNGAL